MPALLRIERLDLVKRLGCRLLLGCPLLAGALALPGAAWSAPAAPNDALAPAAAEALAVSYANATDEELTVLGARWGDLKPSQRRALLAEVKMRMARAREQGAAKGVLHIQLRRRYGAVPVPPTAGSGQLRVRIVGRKLDARDEKGGLDGQRFGVGFEQRKGDKPRPSAEGQNADDGTLRAADSD